MIHRTVSDNQFQIDALDGLRGFAALIVVVSHASLSGMLFIPHLDTSGTGKAGVFLFFLLSAFLLTLPLLRKGKELMTVATMSHYWQRRFFRIYPLYTLYLLTALFSTWALGTQGALPFSLDIQSFINHLLLQEGKGVTWSIAVEFKFYFILPLIVFAVIYLERFGIAITITFLIALLGLSQLISPQSNSLPSDPRLLPYMPIFIIGITLAVMQNYTQNKPFKHMLTIYKYLGYIGVVGTAIMTPALFSKVGYPIAKDYFHQQFILYALLWSGVLLSAVNVPGMIQKLFTLPALRFYGALSFSFYLFHPIFIELIQSVTSNGYAQAWLMLFATTLAAYLSFQWLEAPVSKFSFFKNKA